MPRVLPHIGMSGKPADGSASWSRYTGLAARDRTPGSGATPTYGGRTPETSAAARPSAACGTPEDTIAPHPRPHPPGCRTRSRTWQHKQIPLRTASARRAGPSLRSGKRGGIHRPDGPVLPTHDAAVLRTARAGCPKPEGPAARWGISPRRRIVSSTIPPSPFIFLRRTVRAGFAVDAAAFLPACAGAGFFTESFAAGAFAFLAVGATAAASAVRSTTESSPAKSLRT